MDIGGPTNIQYVAHVTFDRFSGFLGLPSEFEPDVPKKAPSASATVFGVSTESMQLSYDSRGNCVPVILLLLQSRLYDQGGLQVEGIFRITGENSEEEYVREQLNKGLIPDGIDVHCLAGLIKAWFRELPRGVLDPLPAGQVMQCESDNDFVKVVRLLPQTEASLLNWAINLMADVVQFEHINKMNSRNLALVFAPNMSKMADPLTALMYAVQVMKLLKSLTEKILGERGATSSHVDKRCSNEAEEVEKEEEEEKERDEIERVRRRRKPQHWWFGGGRVVLELSRCFSTAEKEENERLTMDIGGPTNIQHVAHVTFDRFNGFLGLPSEFEPDVPKKAPSASASVFGVSTESMQLSYDSRGNCVPVILLLLQSRLYDQGCLQIEGIFRITGENSEEEYVREQLNKGLIPDGIDVHCLAGLIKAWFRELPRGVLDPLPAGQVMQCESDDDFVKVVRLLPQTEASLLNWAINLMADVVQFEHVNKMNSRNLALVFAPNMSKMADPLTALMYAVQVMKLLKSLTKKTLGEREATSSHVDT
ncbi:hypothetical protein F2Q68_00042649, partial [Brassica cretica]